MQQISICNQNYYCNLEDYEELQHKEYNNLKLYPIIGKLERYIGLLNNLCEILNSPTLMIQGVKYSSFIANQSKNFEKIYILKQYRDIQNIEHLEKNIDNLQLGKKVILSDDLVPTSVIFVQEPTQIDFLKLDYLVILSTRTEIKLNLSNYKTYLLSNSNLQLMIHTTILEKFIHEFHYYFDPEHSNVLDYDNLINLCIMVKNGGKEFENMLESNLSIIDRFTILDTGSTDDTVENIRRILANKKGKIYEEPFINFRESRNRCLELAGKSCKYNVMLDDTYCIGGNLREFLNTIRSDQLADSYSLLIKSGDTQYYSNRITKSEKGLRYIFILHEVIQQKDNVNVIVPNNVAWIDDIRSDYMEKRTNQRKQYDLKCLFQMIEEDPDEPRHYYYVAQTYNCIDNREKAAEYFKKRAFHHKAGFDQEKVDALFEMTRLYNFHLNKSWEECKKYYELCYEWDPERPDSSYFLGIHYYLENNMEQAIFYFKRAFKIGYPVHRQYSLKPTLSFHFLPKFLSKICYQFKEYKLGLECCELFLQHNSSLDEGYSEVIDWYNIYKLLVEFQPIDKTPIKTQTPIFCFIAPGGFKPWRGSSILKEGVGGSETYIIEMARHIQKNSNYEVLVFCNCTEEEIFEDVKYLRLDRVTTELNTYEIEHCVISRFSEYIPLAINSYVKNIHVVVHDLSVSGNIIPVHEKIKNIFCLTEWHRKYFSEIFPEFKQIIKSFHYGINFGDFKLKKNDRMIKNSFIYSSFPNRGLIVILNMWPRIKSKYNDAILNIFCDLENEWVNKHYAEEIKEIKRLLNDVYVNDKSIKNHGWVEKKILARYWKKSEIWFYPCKFKETFCLTALEAALSRTFVICNSLAALEDVVGDRGVSILGNEEDVMTKKWQNKAFDVICYYLDHPEKRMDYIKRNYLWALEHSWEKKAKELLGLIECKVEKFKETKACLEIENVGKFYGYDDFITSYIIKNGDWEEENNEYFEKYIDKNSVCVDIGAYIGTNTIKMSNRAKKVYAFEPVKQTFEILERNIRKNNKNNVILNNFGIGDENSTIEGFWYPTEKLSGQYGPNYGAMRIKKEENFINTFLNQPTKIFRLESVIEEKIDFMKIDVEGYEQKVITGAINLIKKYKPIIILESQTQDINILLSLGYRATKIGKMDNNYILIPYEKTDISLDLNYADMYNWTNDLPKNSKVIFEQVLEEIRNDTFSVLEIGTFAGVSLICILQILSKADGTAIDQWKNYEEVFDKKHIDSLKNIETNRIEQVFDDNVRKANMENRIHKIKGDSGEVLMDLFIQNKRFDFIYVDGSHRATDVFFDCVLSWKLLNKGGTLAIDDYLYKIEQNDWDIPYHGINRFLEKYKDEYIPINIGYRVFIKKL